MNAVGESAVWTGLNLLHMLLFNLFTISYAVAIWRSGTLPQGAAILLLGYILLMPVGATLGAVAAAAFTGLAAIGACWIAWSIWHRPYSGAGAWLDVR